MSTPHSKLTPISVSRLSPKAPYAFDLHPAEAELSRLQSELGLLGLRKLRFSGDISADGASDWVLQATLGATVVQPCVVTLDPVTTRIDDHVTRRFLKSWPEEADLAEEVEMPEDDSLEPLGDTINLAAILQEALALALPAYPRSPDAEADMTQARPAGAAPITSIDESGLSALSDLKKKLEKGGE
ncbi:MAG: DUF177 domain-containing protein [Pseudomonadota bacterium]